MRPKQFLAMLASVSFIGLTNAAFPTLSGIGSAMQSCVDQSEIAGAVTVVATKEGIAHLESTGYANIATKTPMRPDTLFWIASMTKPITGVAILMLQDDGLLNVADPVAKYIPEFAGLKTPSGKPANLTITQILTHTSGLGEAREAIHTAKKLADLVPAWVAAPMQYEPGARWQYTQSGINAAGRIVEIVSGKSFDLFLQERIFQPLGMKDTTFFLTDEQRTRLVTGYAKNKDTGTLESTPHRVEHGSRNFPPQGSGGLFSTAQDYVRFCQLLLNRGTLEGKRYLTDASFKILTTVQTGELPCGFFRENNGSNYGWSLGTCILRMPHEGVAAMLSPGTFGHGGAWGTQAWIDPEKGVAYLLMVQRSNFTNSDGSDVRRIFQQAAVTALAKRT